MTKQTINLGSSANDGTGDPLRTAFTKINENFDELYIAIDGVPLFDQPLNTTDDVSFNSLTTNVVLDPNGGLITNNYFNGTLIVGSNLTQTPVSILIGGAGPRNEWKFTPDGNFTLPDGGDIKDVNGNSVLGNTQSNVTSVNGQTGDVQVAVLPSTPQELLTGLYATPLSLTATGISDNGVLKATFNGSVQAQAMVDDETLHAFGKSLHTVPTYDLFFGNQPPLTTSWNLPNNELNRTFVCASLNRESEVDNGDGTFTVTPSIVRASIPSEFVEGAPVAWMQMDMTQLLDAIEGNDVMVPGAGGIFEVGIIGSPEYAQAVQNELTNMQCYSKYTSIFHLVAASLGDFIQ